MFVNWLPGDLVLADWSWSWCWGLMYGEAQMYCVQYLHETKWLIPMTMMTTEHFRTLPFKWHIPRLMTLLRTLLGVPVSTDGSLHTGNWKPLPCHSRRKTAAIKFCPKLDCSEFYFQFALKTYWQCKTTYYTCYKHEEGIYDIHVCMRYSLSYSNTYIINIVYWPQFKCFSCNCMKTKRHHGHRHFCLIKLQWSQRFKTTHSASKIWSSIEIGLKIDMIEGCLYWKYTSGATDIPLKMQGIVNEAVLNHRDHCTIQTIHVPSPDSICLVYYLHVVY